MRGTWLGANPNIGHYSWDVQFPARGSLTALKRKRSMRPGHRLTCRSASDAGTRASRHACKWSLATYEAGFMHGDRAGSHTLPLVEPTLLRTRQTEGRSGSHRSSAIVGGHDVVTRSRHSDLNIRGTEICPVFGIVHIARFMPALG